MNATKKKILATYKGGIHSLIHAAIRSDGALFKRHQRKTSYGYQWSAWRLEQFVSTENIPLSLNAGFSTLFKTSSPEKWRLPNKSI